MLKDIQGIDVSTEISLLEYGLIMGKNEHCTENEYVCIFNHPYIENKFQLSYITIDDIMDLWEPGSWSEPEKIGEFAGIPLPLVVSVIRENPFSYLYSMVSYWGAIEIFGDNYNNGLTIADVNSILPYDDQIEEE